MLRGIKIRGLVEKLRKLGQHQKPMRKSRWYPHLQIVFGRKICADPTPKGGGRFTYVHRDIEHFTCRHPYQLALWLPDLIMQAAQHSFGRAGVIILHKSWRPTGGFLECALVIAFQKESAAVTKYLGFED